MERWRRLTKNQTVTGWTNQILRAMASSAFTVIRVVLRGNPKAFVLVGTKTLLAVGNIICYLVYNDGGFVRIPMRHFPPPTHDTFRRRQVRPRISLVGPLSSTFSCTLPSEQQLPFPSSFWTGNTGLQRAPPATGRLTRTTISAARSGYTRCPGQFSRQQLAWW